jgi:hypothetical protein
MFKLNDLLVDALKHVTSELDCSDLLPVSDKTNVLAAIDSFTVVDLMLETEMRLEEQTGTYVTLADETIFDVDKSPLLQWNQWVKFVEARIGK